MFSISQSQPEIVAKYIKITPNALKVLESINKSSHSQIVLSNTQPKSLDMFLHSINIEHYSMGDVELAECHPNGVGYLFSHPTGRIVATNSPTELTIYR